MRSALIAVLVALLAPGAAAACSPDAAPDPSVPTWRAVNGFELGSRKATTAEADRYLEAVAAAAPDRTRLGTLATSVQGRPLRYLVVTAPEELGRVEGTAAAMRRLRLAQAGEEEAGRIADTTPAIAWVSSNVHGNEPSGLDASMRLIHEMVAGRTCADLARLRSLVTVFLPTQNPDGREANTRANANGFDMNRDWFARTQPETDGKLDLIRRYPPILYIDAHEQGGTAGFFPPNADPIHHEISDEALSHINDVYGPAMREAADAAGFDYTNYTTYDLFFMGFGDTVPSTAFGAAGMTFEKGSASPYSEKTFEQYTTQRASVDAAAAQKPRLVREWAAQFRTAVEQGSAGALEPNVVVQPTNTVRFPVPDVRVHGYVLRADRHGGDAAKLVRRLRALDVEVHRLAEPVTVPALDAFGAGPPGAAELPAGTYYVPMAQSQKHWVQALLGEDAYVPFPYFYDVSSWSNPLLMGLEGGALREPLGDGVALEPVGALGGVEGDGDVLRFAGDSSQALGLAFDLLRAGATLRRVPGEGTFVVAGGAGRDEVARLAGARGVTVSAGTSEPAETVPVALPKVALLDGTGQSTGFAEFALRDQLGVKPTRVRAQDVGGLLLGDFDVLVIPNGTAAGGLTPTGLLEIQLFARRGGTVVAYGLQGLTVARAALLTTALPKPATTGLQVPGASFALTLDPANPVAWGLDERDFVFNAGDSVLQPGTSAGAVVGAYPDDERFFQGGYAEGTDALKGTPALLDETVGAGHAVLMTFDPNFRAYAEAGLRLFANALLYPRAGGPVAAGRPQAVTPGVLRAAALSEGRDMVVRVPIEAAGVLEGLLARLPRGATVQRDLRSATLRIPNPTAEDVHGRPEVPRVLGELQRRGVRPTLVIL